MDVKRLIQEMHNFEIYYLPRNAKISKFHHIKISEEDIF